MKTIALTVAISAAILAAAPVAAQNGKSLTKCEKALAKETTKLAGGIQKSVSKCLDKIANELLAKGDAVADAAKACAASFGKISSSVAPEKTLPAKFAAKAAAACDPTAPDTKATHGAAEVLDPNDADGLQAGALGAYCGEFGGDGALESVGEWIDCATQVAACSALQQVAVEYPRAPEWLAQIAVDIAALGVETKFTDAAATASDLVASIDGNADGVADIACGPAVTTCGNGAVDAGEDCDLGDLDGATCADEGFAGGTLACSSGCVFATSGCWATRYVDNGDGTITDNLTGLEWQKQVSWNGVVDPGNPQDADNRYPWAGTCSVNTSKACQPDAASSAACFDGFEGDSTGCDECTGGDGVCNVAAPGVTIWQWLDDLNSSSFAGHDDWRIPRMQDLVTILDLTESSPAVGVAFRGASCGGACVDVGNPACSCTPTFDYWSASTNVALPITAWIVNFTGGNVVATNKPNDLSVRAVRSGS